MGKGPTSYRRAVFGEDGGALVDFVRASRLVLRREVPASIHYLGTAWLVLNDPEELLLSFFSALQRQSASEKEASSDAERQAIARKCQEERYMNMLELVNALPVKLYDQFWKPHVLKLYVSEPDDPADIIPREVIYFFELTIVAWLSGFREVWMQRASEHGARDLPAAWGRFWLNRVRQRLPLGDKQPIHNSEFSASAGTALDLTRQALDKALSRGV